MAARKSAKAAKSPVTEVRPPRLTLTASIERRAALFVFVLIAFASARICWTYTVFNHTSDEPNHIACGMEWVQRGSYTFEAQHPPLARVAAVIGPYLLGARIRGPVKPNSILVPWEGSQILYRGGQYDLTLALARLGILPFFWVACLAVYIWARHSFGTMSGVIALFLFSFAPPILAHGGLATTDMPLTAFVSAAFLAAIWMAERPSALRGTLFGVCSGLAVCSKFSSLPFLAACLGCTFAFYLWREKPGGRLVLQAAKDLLPALGTAMLSGALVIWAIFRFSIGPVWFSPVPLPAPELFSGLQEAWRHNSIGHHTYLLGKFSQVGFWYYYPIVLAVKTPLALILLFGAGLWLTLRTRMPHIWQPFGLVTGVFAVGLYSRINIGVRHILPIYMGICLFAALAIVELPKRLPGRWGKIAVGLSVLWFAASSLLSHPDYLAYFNELAGSQPEKIVVDSDLDWGQDLKRLGQRLQELGARSVAFHTSLVALPQRHGLPPVTAQDPFAPSLGWNAVSMTSWKLLRFGLVIVTPDGIMTNHSADRTLWPDQVPRGERVGKTILLWNVNASVPNSPTGPKPIVLH